MISWPVVIVIGIVCVTFGFLWGAILSGND